MGIPQEASARRLAFLLALAAELRPLTERYEIEHATCVAIARELSADQVQYEDYRLDDGTVVIGPVSSRSGMPAPDGPFRLDDFPAAELESRTVVVNSSTSDQLDGRARRTYADLGIGAFISAPALGNSHVLHRLTVASATERTWSAEEIELIEDIAQRVQSVAERAAAPGRTRIEDDRLRSALEIETVAVVYARADGTLLGANDAFLRISEFERRDLELGLLRLDDLTSPQHAPLTIGATRELLETRVARPYEKQYVRVDGSRWWALVTAKRMADNVVVEFAFDITAHKATERDRSVLEDQQTELLRRERSARRAAEAALRSRDQFLADVSHELRTPLAAILLWARLLASGRAQGREAEAIATIQRSAETQRVLIDDLLDASRIRAGKMRLSLRPVRLDRVVRDTLEAMRPAAAERGIQITYDAKSEATARLDVERFAQIVRNLLDNAIRFSEPGSAIGVETRVENDRAVVEVVDTGHGIDAKLLPHVFERFRRGDSEVGHDGLGLGLSIARDLVGLHGGTISAHSAGRGHGSTFTVRLPLRGRAATTTRARGAAPQGAHGSGTSRGRLARVLPRDPGRS